MKPNVNTNKETNLFSSLAHTWWDEAGPFKALHAINPVRIQYILSYLQQQLPHAAHTIKILDVGCGGGLLSAPFSRLGYTVLGIDTSKEAIEAAQIYAEEHALNAQFECTDLSNISDTFDVIFLSEILEHVDNPSNLLQQAVQRLKPNGLLFFSTLNRTAFSYIAGILIAENIIKWAPKGTHQWKSLLKPSEIVLPLETLGVNTLNLAGIEWSPLKRKWTKTANLHGNYIGVGKKMVGNAGIEPATL